MRAPGEMEVFKIKKVIAESPTLTTLLFTPKHLGRWSSLVPGQFLMVWVPGVDEVPMSLSYLKKTPFVIGITVQNIGPATSALCSLEEGDKIGLRGPYGNGFSLPSKDDFNRIIGVSGGVGAASTILPMEWAFNEGFETVNLVGARNKDLILFQERWEEISNDVQYSTDNGSFGHSGFITELLTKELMTLTNRDLKRTMIFTCGPEIMMVAVKKVLDQFNVKGQFSLERYMKCGIGICDSCSMSGKRICMNGPIFTVKEIDDLREFGKFHRNRSGTLIPITECVK